MCRNTYRIIKQYVVVAMILIMLGISGCGAKEENIKEESIAEENIAEENIDVQGMDEQICLDIYEEAEKENTFGSIEVVQSLINRFGENGYAAVDDRNQINMVGAERVEAFCEQAAREEDAEVTIVEVAYNGGFTRYDLKAKGGTVEITRKYYLYQNGYLENVSTLSYVSEAWEYSGEGYLFFEDYNVPGVEEPYRYIALRIQPLDEICREYNRLYILPVGYKKNNLFLTDWNEEDFNQLDFYDLFDVLYPKVTGQALPYTAAESISSGVLYHIPKEEFENVIQSYFSIDSITLQAGTTYCEEDASYEYRPRGFFDGEPAEVPYPEVVGFKENQDKTITLTVNVVYPKQKTAKVYAHEVVVRPLEDGSFQYVSNRILPPDDSGSATWHVDRLTKEEWKQYYGEETGTEY